MSYTITVSFDENNEFQYKLLDEDIASLSRSDASEWLHREYEALECAPRNPIGKILLLDIILDVAKYGGKARFASDDWGTHFAKCCAAILKRDACIDVPNLTVR